MSFRPAGMSDDEDSDGYSHHGDEDFQGTEQVQEEESQIGKDLWSDNNYDYAGGSNKQASSLSVQEFRRCLMSGDVSTVKKCLDIGKLDVDQPFRSTYASSGSRPLFIACERGHPEVVQLLLQTGASLGPDHDRFNPLMAVCSSDCSSSDDLVKCAEMLIETDEIDLNACQTQQMTALMFASLRGHDKLVQLLLLHGKIVLNMDAVDSQRWSALMFAVDSDHGHVARRLLEAGADPDLANVEGTVASDMAASRGNVALQSTIERFSKRKSLLSGLPIVDQHQHQKYNELDNVLLALDAGEYMRLFAGQKVDLEQFLQLNEQDLISMGIDKVGVRKKMVDAIVEMHKKDWEKTSLPKIQPRDKQNGIYLTCPDAVVMTANVARHLKFLSANIQFLKRHLQETPQMLRIGQDVANVQVLGDHVRQSFENALVTYRQLDSLKTVVDKLAKDENYLPADKIGPKSNNRVAVFTTTSLFFVTVTAGALIYQLLWRK